MLPNGHTNDFATDFFKCGIWQTIIDKKLTIYRVNIVNKNAYHIK